MKQRRMIGSVLALGLIVSLSWVGIARAQTRMTTVNASQVIDSTVYSAGKDVEINGTINGDLYCVGQDVVITGTVHGDVLCAAQTITISGTVTGSVRAAAQDITLQNSIGHSLTAAGQHVILEQHASVADDATIASSMANIDGIVGRDLTLASPNATVLGSVGRNLDDRGSSLALDGSSHVGGNLEYTSRNDVFIASGAHVTGAVTHHMPQQHRSSNNWNMSLWADVFSFMTMLVLGIALVLIWPKKIHDTSQLAVKQLGKVVLLGIVGSILAPISLFILALTFVGIPLAVLGIGAVIVIVALSGPIAAYYVGSMVLAKSKNPIIIMLVGEVILGILYMIPIVGAIAAVIAFIIGVGAVLLQIFRHTPRPVYKV